MTKRQTLLPSAHLDEGFMPIAENEPLFCDVLRKIPDIGFYRGISRVVHGYSAFASIPGVRVFHSPHSPSRLPIE